MRAHVLVILLFLAAAACGDDSSGGGPDDGSRGGAGKADLVGTCEGSDCDGPGMGGGCYCDDACVDHGDCCADRAALCGGGEPAVFTVETVASTGDIGDRPSLAIDPAGAPAIAFYDFDNTGAAVRVARRAGDGWEHEVITDDDENVTGTPISIAFAPDGRPHVVYRGIHREQLDDGAWRRTAVALGGTGATERSGDDASVAVGLDGVVHVVALRTRFVGSTSEPHTELRHAWRDGAGWHNELVTTVVGFGAHGAHASELAIDGDGHLHVALTAPPEDALIYLRRGASGWSSRVVASFDREWPGRPRLAVGADGAAHIAYTPDDDGVTRLVHATGRAGAFTLTAVDPVAGDVTVNSVSIAVAADGVAHMAFEAGGALRHARSDVSASELVTAVTERGSETAIAAGGGDLHVAFHDEAADDLRTAVAPIE